MRRFGHPVFDACPPHGDIKFEARLDNGHILTIFSGFLLQDVVNRSIRNDNTYFEDTSLPWLFQPDPISQID